ncbi:MAG: hypothetical protein ACREMA_01775 [Longimicrobiales bacterium]
MRISGILALVILIPVPLWAQQHLPPGLADAHIHLNDPATWVRIMDELGLTRSVALAGREANNSTLLAASSVPPQRPCVIWPLPIPRTRRA